MSIEKLNGHSFKLQEGESESSSWINSTASVLQSHGVVMYPYSASKKEEIVELLNCAYCGMKGEVEQNFARTNRKEFCSINCLRAATRKMYETTSTPAPKKKEVSESKVSSNLTIEVNNRRQTPTESKVPIGKQEQKASPAQLVSYDWTYELETNPNFISAPVTSFSHVPVTGIWQNVQPGMKVEVENRDVHHSSIAFWVASVIKIHGYKVLLRFEGYGSDSSRDFWTNLCLPEVHPVGWCATQNKPLIPPTALNSKNKDWRSFLVKRLTGARTIPHNFLDKVNMALASKYEIGAQFEIVDKNRICQVRLAKVVHSIGKRLRLLYYDQNSANQDDFWCHENSSLIHPCGWAKAVGQEIVAPTDYDPPLLELTSEFEYLKIKEGMKLEAIDPLNLSAICAATVKKVLKHDYIMVRVDCYEEDEDGSDWFCYHLTSSSIFPTGFCSTHSIPLTPPKGYAKDAFSWESYFKETKTSPAPLQAIKKKGVKHNFRCGMKLEAADLMDPRLICVATIGEVIENLMKIHFDGWEEEYDQWLDASSPDIYPIGWSELVSHRLEPPRSQPLNKKQNKIIKKKGKKAPTLKRTASPAEPKEIKRVKSGVKEDIETSGEDEVVLVKSSIPTTLSSNNGDILTPMGKNIPKLIDSPSPSALIDVEPLSWQIAHVSHFLSINDCGAYCDSFSRNVIDGPKLLNLTKDQIIVLTGMKVGPAVKILDLVSQLKKSANAARVRKNIFPSN